MSEMAAMLEQTSTAMAQQNDALTKSQKQVATLEEARERLQDELLVDGFDVPIGVFNTGGWELGRASCMERK